MQLFIPSLIVIILAAILAFLVIPRIGPMILAMVSLVALIAVGVHHYSLFYSEYQLSTWQNGLAANASFIVLGMAILFIIASILYMFTGSSPVSSIQNAITAPIETLEEAVLNSSSLPPASTATNAVTSMLNKGMNSIMGNNSQTNRKNTNTAQQEQGPGAMEAISQTFTNIKNTASKAIPGLGFKASEV